MNVRNKKKQKSTTDRDSDADGQYVRRSLRTTTAKEEQEIVDVYHSGSNVPNPIIQKSYQVLGKERNQLGYFSTCHFKDLCGMYEEFEGHSLVDSVDLVLTDPPYNTRSDLNCANSEDDIFTNTDIANFVGVTDVTLRTGGHAIIFWSFRQFCNWYDEFFDVCYDVEDDDDDSDDKERTEEDDSDKQKKRSEDVFMVEKFLFASSLLVEITTVTCVTKGFIIYPCRKSLFMLGRRVYHWKTTSRGCIILYSLLPTVSSSHCFPSHHPCNL